MSERKPFEGVNRTVLPAERRPVRTPEEAALRLALEELKARRRVGSTAFMDRATYEKLEAWALENGLDPFTGKPYP